MLSGVSGPGWDPAAPRSAAGLWCISQQSWQEPAARRGSSSRARRQVWHRLLRQANAEVVPASRWICCSFKSLNGKEWQERGDFFGGRLRDSAKHLPRWAADTGGDAVTGWPPAPGPEIVLAWKEREMNGSGGATLRPGRAGQGRAEQPCSHGMGLSPFSPPSHSGCPQAARSAASPRAGVRGYE